MPELGMAATTAQLVSFTMKALLAQTQLGGLLSRKEENKLYS